MRDESVSKECSRDKMVVSPHCLPKRDLSHDMVLGPRLDKVKEEEEEVTEEHPSSLWMLGNSSLTAANASCGEKSECWIDEL